MICDFAFCSSRVFYPYSIEEKEKILVRAHSSDMVPRFFFFLFQNLNRSLFHYSLDSLSFHLRLGRTSVGHPSMRDHLDGELQNGEEISLLFVQVIAHNT